MAHPRSVFGPRSLLTLGVLMTAVAIWTVSARGQSGTIEITVDANEFAFAPTRIEVQKDSLVKVTFHARDIAHSFVVDGYRISKRAGAGQTVTFEFRADQTGTFPFYCNLTLDERCRGMKGELVVR